MKVSGTKLSMTRGDSESLTIKCFMSGEPHPFEIGDIVTFTVRSTARAPVVFQKTVMDFNEQGWAVIGILPEDTERLRFGSYVYDIQLRRADGTVTTVVPISTFTLMEEVTY